MIDFEVFRGDLGGRPVALGPVNGGQPPDDPVLMFKVPVLQTPYTLSDDQTEYHLKDRLSFMRFAGLALDDAVLDAKTIWLYREPLARSGAAETLVTRFEALLREKGWLAMGGQIIDATVIEARRPRLTQTEKDTIKGGGTPGEWTPARRAQTDRDGRSTIKRGKKREVAPGAGHKRQTEIAVPAFGYENHIGIDREYGFLRRYTVTMPRLTMAVSSAPCSIATTPQARCGPTPPTPRRPTWHSSSARDSRLNSIAKSRAASRCRCTSPVAMPPAPWYARASNTFAAKKCRFDLVVRRLPDTRPGVKIGLANLAHNFARLAWLEAQTATACSTRHRLDQQTPAACERPRNIPRQPDHR